MKLCITLFAFAILSSAALSAAKAPQQTIELSITVPSGGWTLDIKRVLQVENELWVHSHLTPPRGSAITVISQAKASLTLTAPTLPIKHFVTGKTWNFENKEDVTFIASTDIITKKTPGATTLYTKAPAHKTTYIVSLKKELFTQGKADNKKTLTQIAERHAKACGGTLRNILSIINGYVIEIDDAGSKKLQALPEVKFVEKDRIVTAQ